MPLPPFPADDTVTNSQTIARQPPWTTWALRPVLLFVAAYTIIGILHEVAHALTAYFLRVPSTLFHLYVQLAPSDGTFNERAVIRAAGPVFCLVLGLACWFRYRRAKETTAELFLLYLGWFGIATFFGNLMGTPFVGDFSGLALTFEAPMAVRYATAIAGLVSLCGLSFFMGTMLRKFSPAGTSGITAMLGMIVLPVTLGTAISILIFLPMLSSDWVVSRVGESAFWIFAAVGILVSRKHSAETSQNLGVRWPDLAGLAIAIVVVRVMSGGIALVP